MLVRWLKSQEYARDARRCERLARERTAPTSQFMYKTAIGYCDKGFVSALLDRGWEIITSEPTKESGFRHIYVLRKQNPDWEAEGDPFRLRRALAGQGVYLPHADR